MNLFRKSLALAVVFSMVFAMTAFAATPAEGFNLRVDGETVAFSHHTHVFMSDGEVLLPLRYLVEALGGNVSYDYVDAVITLHVDGSDILFRLHEDFMNRQDGTEFSIVNIDGRTHVDTAFIEELMDVTILLDNESRALMVAGNTRLNRIFELMGSADALDMPAMEAEMASNIQMVATMDGEVVDMDMVVSGTIHIDFANRFQHIFMTTSMMGMDIVSEVYDNGEAMFIVADGMVMMLDSSSFDLADDMMAQFSPVAGIDLDRRFFAGLRLIEGDGIDTVSGEMTIPEEFFNDMLGAMGDISAFLPDLDDFNMEMTIHFNAPIRFSAVFERSTNLMTSMEAFYDMEMTVTVDGETAHIHMVYTMSMPNINYNAEFDTVVPAEIVEAAVDMSSFLF